jgi:hypothetical protein
MISCNSPLFTAGAVQREAADLTKSFFQNISPTRGSVRSSFLPDRGDSVPRGAADTVQSSYVSRCTRIQPHSKLVFWQIGTG